MNKFLKKISLERRLLKGINNRFKKPYLNGLTLKAINRWVEGHGGYTDAVLGDIKEISFLLSSWSDRSRVPFDEELKFEEIERAIEKIY